ncbi:MAG: carbohydrate kinase [Rhodobacteraceae bacterium]|nr:carbohydrate kinase [Paracoccaceae bacterium]
MKKVWVLGEALIDFVPLIANGETAFVPRNGGSPYNAAKAAARQGAEVGFLGALSTDLFGDKLAGELLREGIDTASTPRLSNPTTLAFVELESGEPRYAFFNTATATQMTNPDAEIGTNDILHVGSISLVDQPGADNIANFALRNADRVILSVDPNARPVMTPDVEDWRNRLFRLIDAADIVKLSDEDLALLAPGASAEEFAGKLIGNGVPLVVVTTGPEGAFARSAVAETRVGGHRIEIVDAVGAGDTVTGTILAQAASRNLSSGTEIAALDANALREILELAIASAAVNCMRSGCNPPTLDEARAFLAERS